MWPPFKINFCTIERFRFASVSKKTIIKTFASLCYNTVAITGPQYWSIWTCLHYRGMCCTGRCLHSTPPWSELHLDISTLKVPVLLLEVSTPQGSELHLDMSILKRPVLLVGLSTPQGPELHLALSTLQRPELHLDMYTPRKLSCS